MSQNADSDGHGVVGKLVSGLENLASAAAERAMSKLKERVGDVTDKLTDYAANQVGGAGGAAISKGMEKMKEGKSPVSAAVSAGVEGGKEQVGKAFGKGGGGEDGDDGGGSQDKNDFKATNIIEAIEVGVPVWLAYNQWTQFKDFPTFMKKVENVEQKENEKLTWKAQVLWSHRTWESTIIEQVPDERIVWQSKGEHGFVDGTVSFHEITPDLTRILVVLQYHSKGFVEKTGNLWRAPGRRVRLELKHFVRHVMTDTVLHPDDIKGWRGEIRDGEIVEQGDSQQQDQAKPDQQKPEQQKADQQKAEKRDGQQPQEADGHRQPQGADSGSDRSNAKAGKSAR